MNRRGLNTQLSGALVVRTNSRVGVTANPNCLVFVCEEVQKSSCRSVKFSSQLHG